MSTLVVGGGLLGAAVVRRGGGAAVSAVPWDRPDDAATMLRDAVRQHVAHPGWTVVWSAGAGVVGTDEATLQQETEHLRTVLAAAAEAPTPGRFVLTSSAGGVHGRGSREHIDETTPPDPVSAYGHNKVAQELLVRDWSAANGAATLIARPSNIYGPGQRLGKQQGLVSQVLWRSITRTPVVLSVSEETQRDFVYVDDVANGVVAWTNAEPPPGVSVRLFAAGRSITLSRLFRVAHHVTGIEPRIVRVAPAVSGLQPRQLRFRPRHVADAVPSTPLEVGVAATWRHLVAEYARSGVRAAR